MNRPPLILALTFAVLCGISTGPALGQDPPATPTLDEALPDEELLDTSHMTLEEVIAEAYATIEKAEEKGPDTNDLLARTSQLVGVIRLRNEGNVDADFIAGRVNILVNRPREAIGFITKYTEHRKGENDWLAFKLLGQLYLEAKYYQMARDKYRRASELNPREPEPFAGLAQTEWSLSRYDKAVDAARKAVELDSRNPESEREPRYYAVLADALLGMGDLEPALEAATTAAETARRRAREDATDVKLWRRVDAYCALIQKTIGSMLARHPERTEFYVRLIRISRERADIAHLIHLHRVLESVEQGITATEPTTPPELLIEKAKLLVEVGNTDEAVEVLTGLLAKHPDQAEARQLLEQIKPPEAASPDGA